MSLAVIACSPAPVAPAVDAGADPDGGPTDVDAGSGDAGLDAGAPGAPCERFEAGRTVGTRVCLAGAQPGYTLFSPLATPATYLLDLDGRVVHQWNHTLPPGVVVYLLEDGRLLRTTDPGPGPLKAGGQGGGVELIAWDGTVEWSFTYNDDRVRAHHDVAALPNGNIVMIAWERLSADDAVDAGRRAALPSGELWSDHLIEVHPEADGGGSIVWEWHAWDHLVQDNDPTRSTFGLPSDHPGRIDIDVGGARNADWLHVNSVFFDEPRNQLLLTVHNTSEVWVIDHATTTAEAAGAAGELLYRWGNPAAWGAGRPPDRRLYLEHDAHLIAAGLPGAGHLLVFNNGDMQARTYSSVDELELPRAADGTFDRSADGGYGPDRPLWTFEDPARFDSNNLGGAQRLRGGTTLICEGAKGRLFEVTPGGELVWEYQVPLARGARLPQGSTTPSSPVFRAYRYEASYPGLAGRDLTPGALLELP